MIWKAFGTRRASGRRLWTARARAAHRAIGQRYFDAGCARDVDILVQLEGELSRIGQQFAATVGGGAALIDGAFDKVLWRLHDNRFPLRLLPPYEGAHPAAADAFFGFLQTHYPLGTSGWIGVAAEDRFVDFDAEAGRGGCLQEPVVELEWIADDQVRAEWVFGHVEFHLRRVHTGHPTGVR